MDHVNQLDKRTVWVIQERFQLPSSRWRDVSSRKQDPTKRWSRDDTIGRVEELRKEMTGSLIYRVVRRIIMDFETEL